MDSMVISTKEALAQYRQGKLADLYGRMEVAVRPHITVHFEADPHVTGTNILGARCYTRVGGETAVEIDPDTFNVIQEQFRVELRTIVASEPPQEWFDALRREVYAVPEISLTPSMLSATVSVAPGDYVALPVIPVRMVPVGVKNGLQLIGKTQVKDSLTGETRDLTTEEISWQKDAENWELKERLRSLIEIGVGDPLDQQANTDKQVQLVTGLVVRMYRLLRLVTEKLVANGAVSQSEVDDIIPSDVKAGYDDYADNYANAVAAGVYKDRVDVDDPSVMIPRIMQASGVIAELVKTEYIDKRV